MDQREALKETMRHFRIKASVLSRASGVQERQISLFLAGKDLRSGTLHKLVVAADEIVPGARAYFCTQLAGKSLVNNQNWRTLISSANPKDIEEILSALAERWSILNEQRTLVGVDN